MAKFKEGDRVRNTDANCENIPLGSIGTVQENSHIPYVLWDNVGVVAQNEDFLELITEPITESSSPTPEMGPVEGTMEYWRFLFAGQAMQGYLASYAGITDDPKPENIASKSLAYADALIAELKKGGKP